MRVAGIDVGKVRASASSAASCTWSSRPTKGVAVARTARAEIKLATILGQHYLDLVPGKGDRLDGGGTIPLARTKSAYTIDKFQVDANDAVQGLDEKALATAVDTLTHNLDGDPDANREALKGIAQVSADGGEPRRRAAPADQLHPHRHRRGPRTAGQPDAAAR